MAQKYTPLNMAFLQNQFSPQADSIRNTAAMIMANSGWNQPSQVTLAEIAKAQKKAKADYDSAHKQTFLSSVFDLLSTPLYGVANAMDEALAGHQSDSNDSVASDITKTVGGVFTGLPKGIGAGLRGSTGILDVLPGVDINDEWQSDRTDKTHFSDVAIRKTTGMATGDAMNPANWEKIKPLLDKANNKSIWDKTVFEMAIPDDLSDPEAREKYFRNQMLTGIASDIGGDPLNALFLGGGAAARAAKATRTAEAATEGLDAARANERVSESILSGLNSRASEAVGGFNGNKFQAAPPVSGVADNWRDVIPDAPIAPAAANVPEGATGLKLPVTSLAQIGEKGNFKTLKNIGRRETPIKGFEIGGKEQFDIAKRIIAVARSGDKNWSYKAAAILREHPTMTWTQTEDVLEKARGAIKKLGPRGVEGLAPVLRKRIEADAIASKAKNNPEKRVNNLGEGIGAAVSEGKIVADNGIGAARLKRSEARLANKIVRGFEGQLVGKKSAPGTGEGLARAIASGRNVRYSGPQQARLWNQITTNLKYGNVAKYDKAVRILRAVENYFITKGVIPHSSAKTAESVPLRLSQVAEAIGPSILGKTHAFITGVLRGDSKALAQLSPEQNAVLQALRESEAIAAAPAVQQGIRAGREIAAEIAKTPASAARKKEATNKAIRDIREFVALKGGGDAGARIAGEHTAQLLGQNDAVNAALRSQRLQTEAWLAGSGKGNKGAPFPRNPRIPGNKGAKVGRSSNVHLNDPKFVRSVTNAIVRAADLPSSYQLGRFSGPAARVEDWLGARFNAAYGVQDMRQIFLKQQSSAMSTTGRRAKYLNALGRTYNPSDANLWHEAFRMAQQNGVSSGEVHKLQKEIAATMENLVGGTGLRAGAIADSTVVGRNRLLLGELNANLKRFGLSEYQFVAKKVKDAEGVTHDFSKGTDWIRSWEAWNVKKPYEFLHRFQNVMEFTVREKNMFDEIVTRFASPSKKGDVKYGVNHPRLQGYFFTAEGASQAKQFVRMLEEVSTPNSKALQHFDHVLSKLKAALTIYIPGHHWTNLIGSTYHNWIAGVNNPVRYEQALRVMDAQRGRYGDIANFDKLAGPKALEQAMARSLVKPDAGLNLPAAGTKTIITMQSGEKVTADMIYTAMFREGILPSAKVLEEVGSDVTTVLDKFRPLKGHGQRAVHAFSEGREHLPRIALFIDRLSKHKGSFASALNPATRAVRKWHPDGLDLTKFERNVMRRIFPFYSWTRKAIPLAIEATIFAGPKVMAYPRLMEAIALANGIDPADRTRDPFPNDQMFPDWLRDRGIGPVMGSAGNYGVINPSTPILDTLTLLGHPGQSSIDMLNPMIKVPIEANQGATLGRQIPIGPSNEAWMDYAAKQIPIVSQAGRASGQFGVSESTKAEGFPNYTNILNLLTGAKMVDTGKYQKSSQFDLREYLKQKKEQQGR